MKSKGFGAMHVNIIGVVVILIVVLVGIFGMIRPKKQETEVLAQAADAAEKSGGTDEDNRKSAADLVASKKKTVQIKADWAVYSTKYMPDLKWNPNILEEFYLRDPVNDIPAQWGRWVTAWYDAQRRDGVSRAPGVEFPVPPLVSDPNGIANLTSITFPTPKAPWKVSLICQTFDDAMAHLRRFNGMLKHGMPVVDGVTLSGHSPQLTLNYNLALYVIPAEAPPPMDPRIGTGTGGGVGSGGGMGGGMSNGMVGGGTSAGMSQMGPQPGGGVG